MASSERIYLDTEYAYDGMNPATGRPTSNERRQLVQISAIRFDTASGRVIDEFDVYVHPTYLKALPDFFVELTGISQQDLNSKAISMQEGLDALWDFCADTEVWTFDKDEEVIKQNYSYISMEWEHKTPFVRVKPLLQKWGVDAEKYSSGSLYKAVGLKLEGHIHNALHDVISMANAVYILENSTRSVSHNKNVGKLKGYAV